MREYHRGPAPIRPALIEAAGAILIVGGVFGIIQTTLAGLSGTAAGSLPSAADLLALGLDLGSIVTGVLVRTGRLWIVCLNVAAVFAFLYLTAAAEPVALVFGLAHLFVVGVLTYHRPWFQTMAAWRRGLIAVVDPDDLGAPDRGI